MDMMQLVYFKEVAESGHLTNVAKQFNIAQPALSLSISKLEKEVGCPLFDRVGRRIQLNKYGAIYLEYVREVLSLMEEAQRDIEMHSKYIENNLNIGVYSKPFPQIMISAFMDEFPDCKIRQITLPQSLTIQELINEDIDYTISNKPVQNSQVEHCMLSEETMWLAVPSAHRLAKNSEVRLADLSSERFVSLPRDYSYRVLTDEMCGDSGFVPNVVIECFHCQMIELVASGMGIALVTEERSKNNVSNAQVAFIPIANPGYTLKHYILWKKGRELTGTAKSFREYAIRFYEANSTDIFSCGI